MKYRRWRGHSNKDNPLSYRPQVALLVLLRSEKQDPVTTASAGF